MLLLFTVHVLWWYENPDSRAAGRHDAHEDARVVAAGKGRLYLLACIPRCFNVTQRAYRLSIVVFAFSTGECSVLGISEKYAPDFFTIFAFEIIL